MASDGLASFLHSLDGCSYVENVGLQELNDSLYVSDRSYESYESKTEACLEQNDCTYHQKRALITGLDFDRLHLLAIIMAKHAQLPPYIYFHYDDSIFFDDVSERLKCLLAYSEWYALKHGTLVPILMQASTNDGEHAVMYLLLPVSLSDWYMVKIDTSSVSKEDIERTDMIEYTIGTAAKKAWTKIAAITRRVYWMRPVMCVRNIQQSFGVCGVTSLMIAIEIIRLGQNRWRAFVEQSLEAWCESLEDSTAAENPRTLVQRSSEIVYLLLKSVKTARLTHEEQKTMAASIEQNRIHETTLPGIGERLSNVWKNRSADMARQWDAGLRQQFHALFGYMSMDPVAQGFQQEFPDQPVSHRTRHYSLPTPMEH